MTSPAPLWSKERIWEYLERDAFWMSVDDGDNRGLLIYIGDAHADVQVICNDYEADRAAAAQREQALRQQVAALEAQLVEARKWVPPHTYQSGTISFPLSAGMVQDAIEDTVWDEKLREGDTHLYCGNWRHNGEWLEIKSPETGEYFFPDCSWGCKYCGACIGCIRKMIFDWDRNEFDETQMRCAVSPTGWHVPTDDDEESEGNDDD